MNIHVSRAQIEQIAAQIAPMCDGDEQLQQDMLEGETDLISVATRLHEQIARDNEMLAGIAERKATLATREKRLRDRASNLKAIMGTVLRAAKLTKLELPEVTYSVRDGKPKLVVNDPLAVPEPLNAVKWSPDMAKIKAEFGEASELPNWLSRQPATDVVTARTK